MLTLYSCKTLLSLHLYQSGLERTASANEIAGWIKVMDDGDLSRGDLLLGIADLAEMTALVGMMSTSLDLAWTCMTRPSSTAAVQCDACWPVDT